MIMKKLLSVQQAAQYTDLKPQTIYQYSSEGKIPHFKSRGGKRIYFSTEDLDKFMQFQRRELVTS